MSRPAMALAAAVTLLVVTVGFVAVEFVTGGAGDPVPPVPPALPLPDRPPPLEGTVIGRARSISCTADCVDAPVQLDLAEPAAPRLLTDDPHRQTSDLVLRDGRRVTLDPDGAGSSVVDPQTGHRISLGPRHPLSLDVQPDGRIVTYGAAADEDGEGRPAELQIVGAGGTTVRRLPDGFVPSAVTAGPEGWVAVVGDDRECCLNEAELVLVAPGGGTHRVDIDEALDDVAPPMTSEVSMSWSSRGLVVISPAALEFAGDRPPDMPRNWAVVVDPATGEEVARLPDWWQGLAWSPDGTGLLAARRVGDNRAQLRLYWGPGLERSRDLATLDLPFAPHWWLPPEAADGRGR
jgi:hypothetical protein